MRTKSKREREVGRKVLYVRSMQVELEDLRAAAQEEALVQKLNALIEQVRFSDPMSHASLEKVEQWIQMDVEALRDDVAGGQAERAGERIDSILRRLSERNAKCRLLK